MNFYRKSHIFKDPGWSRGRRAFPHARFGKARKIWVFPHVFWFSIGNLIFSRIHGFQDHPEEIFSEPLGFWSSVGNLQSQWVVGHLLTVNRFMPPPNIFEEIRFRPSQHSWLSGRPQKIFDNQQVSGCPWRISRESEGFWTFLKNFNRLQSPLRNLQRTNAFLAVPKEFQRIYRSWSSWRIFRELIGSWSSQWNF